MKEKIFKAIVIVLFLILTFDIGSRFYDSFSIDAISTFGDSTGKARDVKMDQLIIKIKQGKLSDKKAQFYESLY